MKHDFKTGYDVVLLIYAKPEAPKTGRGSLEESAGQLLTLFKKAGLFRQGETFPKTEVLEKPHVYDD